MQFDLQAGKTDPPYFPGLTFPPDQRLREKRQTQAEEGVSEWEERRGEEGEEGEEKEEGEGKIRVKRRGVGGLGGQRGAGEFKGKVNFLTRRTLFSRSGRR